MHSYLRTRLSGGELSLKVSDTGINYYNVFIDSLLHKIVKVTGKDTLINFISGIDKGVHLWGTKRNVYIGGEPKTSEWTMDKAFGAVLLKKAS